MSFNYRFLLLFALLFATFSEAEELGDVLRDAYNFFPDIKKAKRDLENAKRTFRLQKLIFFPLGLFIVSRKKYKSKFS